MQPPRRALQSFGQFGQFGQPLNCLRPLNRRSNTAFAPFRRLHCASRPAPFLPPLQPVFTGHHVSLRRNLQRRLQSSLAAGHQPRSQEERPREPRPEYQLSFTCKECWTRSTHKISKQGYHEGTVVVQCPGCKNRHLVADHLKIFSDQRITLEDILAKKGDALKKAHLEVKMPEDGVIELEKHSEDGRPSS